MRLVQKFLSLRLFQRPKELCKPGEIIWWWEARRFLFNVVVGLTGMLTCFLLLAMAAFNEKSLVRQAEAGGSPLLEIMAVFMYGIAANICYTGGWICEIAAKKIWQQRAAHFGEISFALGIIFSVVLTLVPAAVGLVTLILMPLIHAP